jgi:hypothetical protein
MKEAVREALKRIAENDPSLDDDDFEYVCHHLFLSLSSFFTFATLTPSLCFVSVRF